MPAPYILSIAFLILLAVPVLAWIASLVTPRWLAVAIVLLGIASAVAWLTHNPEPKHDFTSPNPDLAPNFK